MTADKSNQQNGKKLAGYSRRRFVQSVGAAGVATGIAGCLSGDDDDDSGNGNGNGNGEASGTVQMDLGGTVQEGEEDLQQALWDAGLSEDIEIDLINTSGVSDDVQAQFREWLAAGRSEPDILRMDNGWIRTFIARGQILNLEEELSGDAIDKVKNEYFEAGVVSGSDEDGSLYAVPFQIGFPMMFYRKDLVEDAGYDPDGENWATDSMSWADFSEVIADVRDQNDLDYGVATQLDAYEGLSCCTFNEFMSSWGGAYFGGHDYLFGPVNDRPVTVQEEPVLNSIRGVRAMIHGQDDEEALSGYEQVIPEEALQWNEGPSLAEFQDDNAVAVRFWPATIPDIGGEMGDQLGVMPIPYGVTEDESEYDNLGGTRSALGGWGLTMNPNSENLDAAVEVMETMMEPEVRYELLQIGTIPAEPALLEPDEVEPYDPVFAEHSEAFNVAGATSVPRPVTVAWPEQSTAISREVNASLSGDKSPEDAMADLEESLVAIEEASDV